MERSTFTLTYPEGSGFDRSVIHFYDGSPDPYGAYFSESSSPLNQGGAQNRMRLFITDTTILGLACMEPFRRRFTQRLSVCPDADGAFAARNGSDALVVLGPGEPYKDIRGVLDMVRVALECNFDRGCLFVAIGGGVISDMAAFAASMFKRGVAVEFVPTTLLSMVDASVGGKSGCDFDGYKNMIGAFYPAQALHVWPSFVQSLPDAEYRSGLAEALKTALLFLPDLCQAFRDQPDKVLARDQDVLFGTITGCVKAKAAVVQEDFKEHGRRAFLNLGHTFGHALESVAGLGTITHGEAVAWGMARAANLSRSLGLCSAEFCQQTERLLCAYGYDTGATPQVLSRQGMGVADCAQKLLDAMAKDKKNAAGGSLRVIVQTGPGQTQITGVTPEQVRGVLA